MKVLYFLLQVDLCGSKSDSSGNKSTSQVDVVPDTPLANQQPKKANMQSVIVNNLSTVTVHDKDSDVASVTGDHSEHGDHTGNFPLFPSNVFYAQLSPGERITLAYKYGDIPQPTVFENAKKDKHEVAQVEKDKLCTSFPVAPIVHKAFADYTSYFEKASFKSQASERKEATPASNKFDFKPGFQVSPIVDKWELKIHDRAMPQVVGFDGNLESIQSNKQAGLPKNLKLSDGEWGNVQKAASFSLRGISHASWFRECALGAIDEALPVLNPAIANEDFCISKLHDVKQFLRGLDYTFDILARLSVYLHAGVTSSLRHEFLSQESKSMLSEEKMRLFTLPYGSPLVFQGQVHTVAPEVKEHRQEITSTQQLDTVIKLVDSVASVTKGSKPAHSPAQHSSNNQQNRSSRGGSKSKQNYTPKQPKSGSGHQSFPPKGDSRNRGSSDGANRGKHRGKRGN